MKKILLSIIFLFISISISFAYTTVTCAPEDGITGTCRQATSASDITNAIAASASGDGTKYQDGVYITAGSYSLAGFTMKKGLVLKGAGSGSTTITLSSVVSWNGANYSRISGIHFHSTFGRAFAGSVQNIRLDNNSFTGTSGNYIYMWFQPGSLSTGVIDSNTFNVTTSASLIEVDGPDETVSTGYNTPIDYGTANWMYIEGNTVINSDTSAYIEMFENKYAGKFVARYNTISNSSGASYGHIFEQHNTNCWGAVEGACSDGITGGKAQIANNNKIYASSSDGSLAYWRTGTGLIHDNVIDYSSGSDPGNTWELVNYRAYDGCTEGSTPANITSPTLGAGRITRCCTPSYTSGALSGEGVPCINGIGVGPPGGTREPVYIWNNKKTADGTTLVDLNTVSIDSTAAWAIANNREYCLSNSGKPTSCGGVALSYTAYSCPHPLTGLTGTCDTSIAGVIGYNVSAPVSTTHYVSTTGSATWAASTNSGTPCSLATANTNAVAGDTIYLLAGTYNNDGYINPANSGTSENLITYEASGGAVTISGQAYAIYLVNRNYIKVKGITSTSSTSQPLLISNGNYNIIEDCILSGGTDYWGSEIIDGSTYNLVKGSTFSSGTKSTGGVFAIGTEDVSDDASRFNLVENCTMYDGEHHVIAIESGQNTIRNNHLQNADGTQRVFVLYGSTNATGIRNIVEGNFIGYANLQTDNSANSGMTLSAAYNIIRYNQFLRNTEAGISLYTSAGYFTVPSYNKIYNNTIFNNSLGGDQDGTGMNFQNDGNAGTIQGNVIKNNLFYQNNGVKNPPWRTYGGVLLANQTFTNNYQDSNGDPLFVNSTGTDPTSTTLPNLNLQSGSPARDFGAALTTVSSGCNTSTLTLADAGYFQDGTFAPSGTISADWVAVGTVGNTKQITAINYSTNVVSFGSTVSCTNGNSVWLYKNSSGTVVLYNTAPDGGAFEYVVGGGDVTPPVCTITSPTTNTTWPTSSATITVGGSATDGVGVTSISWACPTCTPSSGVATCIGCTGQSVTWSQLVALTSGANVFTATATDGVNTHADAITITYTPGVGPAEHSPSDVRGVTLRGVKR